MCSYLLILRHRGAFVTAVSSSQNPSAQIPLKAACQISRIVEDMLTHNLIRYGQMHM